MKSTEKVPVRLEGIKSVLIRSPNWIGDCVMVLPAIAMLRRALSHGTPVAVLARPWVSEIYQGTCHVDEVIPCRDGPGKGRLTGIIETTAQVRKRRFDLAVVFPRSPVSALIPFLSGVKIRIGYSKNLRNLLLTHTVERDRSLIYRHQIYLHGGLLTGSDIAGADDLNPDDLKLTVPDQWREGASKVLSDCGIKNGERIAAFNPGAVFGPAKRWPEERFSAFGRALINKTGMKIVILGSQKESALGEKIADMTGERVLNLAGKTSLGSCLGVMARSALVVSNDSGLMHAAAALGVPLIAIFGSTDPSLTGPMGKHTRVLKGEAECSPCFLRECPIDLRCFGRVDENTVLSAALELLGENHS